MFDRLRFYLRAIVRPATLDHEMRAEMQLHLDRRVEQLVASGLTAEEARLAARREFGNVAVHQEDGRDARRTRWIESTFADVRFAFRYFKRKPLSSVTIVLVLAFGIAGYAALFGLLQSAIMRPPPGVPGDVPLVVLRGMVRQKDQPLWQPMGISYPELREMSALRTVFSAVTGWTEGNVVVDAPGALDRASARVQFVTDGYFSIVGLRPASGSGLPASVPGAAVESQLVGVISDAMWEDAFGRKEITNRTVAVNGVAVRIIGVAPPQFNGVLGGRGGDRRPMMWLPLATRPTILAASRASGAALSSVDSTLFEAVGLLKSGVSTEQATAAVRVVANNAVSQVTPPRAVGSATAKAPVLVYDADVVSLRGWTGPVKSAMGLEGDNNLAPIFATMGIVATLVLIVVCTNVAALLIVSCFTSSTSVTMRAKSCPPVRR